MESSNAHVVRDKSMRVWLSAGDTVDEAMSASISDYRCRRILRSIRTRRGRISVLNLRGSSVRAHVSTEGDIELTNITASQVVAQNTIGNIFFDGEFSAGGTYEFKSTKGDITIRIPGNSAFRLVAASPTKRIALGDFWNNGFKTQDGRKYVGDVGDGRSSVSVTNFSGQITFLRK